MPTHSSHATEGRRGTTDSVDTKGGNPLNPANPQHATAQESSNSLARSTSPLITPRLDDSKQLGHTAWTASAPPTPKSHHSSLASAQQQGYTPVLSPVPNRQPNMNADFIDYLAAQYEYGASQAAYPYYPYQTSAGPSAYDYGSQSGAGTTAAYGMVYDPTYGYYDPSYMVTAEQTPSTSVQPSSVNDMSCIDTGYGYGDFASSIASTSTYSFQSSSRVSNASPSGMVKATTTHSLASAAVPGPSPTPSGQMSDSDLSSTSARSYHSSKRTRSSASSTANKEKRFLCPTCGEGFARNFNLKSHISCKHQDEKPFACNVCPKTFSRKHDTARHLAARHGYSASDAQAEVHQRYPTGSGSAST